MTHLLYRTPWSSQQCVCRSLLIGASLKKSAAGPPLHGGQVQGFECRLKRVSDPAGKSPRSIYLQRAQVAKFSRRAPG